jgi:hypothetical protein
MSKLLVALIGGMFAVASSVAIAQGAQPAAASKDKGYGAAYENPAAQATAEQKAKAGMAAAEKSKKDPKAIKPDVRDPATLKAQQDLTESGTDPAQAKANVDASKKVARKKPANVKDMTPEERAAWRKQMQEQSKP